MSIRSVEKIERHFFQQSWLVLVFSICILDLGHTATLDKDDLEQWRAKRIARLTAEDGWLTLVGLFWLKEGENTFGRAPDNDIVLDHPALNKTLGTFVRGNGGVEFVAREGSKVTHNGRPITRLRLLADTSGVPSVLASGSLRFFVIERAGRLGVRVRDVEHPARKNFSGIPYFPPSADWVFDARFETYQPAKQIPIINILGMTERMISPGALVFEKEGKTWRLDAVLEQPTDTELFIMFADATSGRETYGAGRYLYVSKPQNGRVRLDFNRAYNPPCAFNEFATCPLPPKQNRLSLRVMAGEMKYADH